jgi:hypothetical protein
LDNRQRVHKSYDREKKMFSSYEKNDDPQKAITFRDGNQNMAKGLVKLLYLLTILFLMFSCRIFWLQLAFCVSIMQNGLQLFIY